MFRHRFFRAVGFAAILFLPSLLLGTPQPNLGGRLVHGDESKLSDLETRALQQQKKGQRLREGAEVLDTLGGFEWAGDRLNFVAENGQVETKVLENRMMERVVQTLETSTGDLQWSVSGRITEYRGNNYLLLTHVILKGKRTARHTSF